MKQEAQQVVTPLAALKLALEALEDALSKPMWNRPKMTNAITAIKEALAQTQEPVAWLEPEWGEKICPEIGFEVTITSDHPRDLCWIPLYPHPPQRTWVGLTEDEIFKLYMNSGCTDIEDCEGFEKVAKVV